MQITNIANLQADLLNQQIIAQHHSKFIQDNLPEIEEGEAPTEAADVGSEMSLLKQIQSNERKARRKI